MKEYAAPSRRCVENHEICPADWRSLYSVRTINTENQIYAFTAKPQQMPFSGTFAGVFYAASRPLAKITVSYVREPASPAEIFPGNFPGNISIE